MLSTLSPRWLSRFALLCTAGSALLPVSVQADENLFGWTRGAETLPAKHFDLYQFTTVRAGKAGGVYRGWDFSTEIEYGITDQLQIGLGVENHYFYTRGVEELEDLSKFQFGGIELSAKYRLLSPFKDVVGLALRVEGGYLAYDDVAGLEQEEFFLDPEIILHKNFLDDTLIFNANAGVQFAWGKKPAEEYDYELALHGALGVSYRFAPNWFIGVEGRIRSEFPEMDFGFNEHTVVFVGPTLHYGAEKWWATLSWGYQVWGEGIDEPVHGKTYAEEARNEYRLKVGFNF